MAETDERWRTLKNTTHVNVAFKSPCSAELLLNLLAWLGKQSAVPVSEAQIQAHMEQLERRRQGLEGLSEMARKAGRELGDFIIPRQFMSSYSFAEFDLGVGHLILSVDLLNAGGELGLPADVGEAVEIFVVGSRLPEIPEAPEDRERRWQVEKARLRQLVRDLVRDFDVRFIFGGYVAFMSRYVSWLQGSRSAKKPRRALPWEFLWPLTYVPECSLAEAALQALPVHHAERTGLGALVQVFDDLQGGYESKYREAAHALGLRAVWELHP